MPVVSSAGELQWRSSRDAVAKPPAAAKQAAFTQDAAVRPGVGEEPRSVVVNRGDRTAQFDPFEDEAAAIPEPAAPAAEPQFDPFEQDDSTPADEEAAPVEEAVIDQPPAVDAPAEPAEIEEAFSEPEIVDDAPSSVEELEAAQEAIDREMMRREVEAGAADELVAPETAEDENSLEVVPEMEDEIVPPADDESYDEAEMGLDEEFDFDLQYGEQLPQQPLTPEEIEARRRELEEERQQHLRECETLYSDVQADSIRNISLDIRLQGVAGEDYPFECAAQSGTFQPRAWPQTVYLWKASGLCHKPLYFEQVQLERYGHSWGPVLQPIMSGAHFFGTVPILPYKMGLESPQECIYTLGYYRPGSCAPYMITQPGFTWRAAAFEAAAVTGVSAAVP